MVGSHVQGLHPNVRNTLGMSSIGPYWNLKSVNYFKESIHFYNFFSSRIFLVSRRLKKKTDLVGKGFNIAQHNAVVAFKKKVFVNSCFLGACTSLCYGHI